jgi:hypothetical protein
LDRKELKERVKKLMGICPESRQGHFKAQHFCQGQNWVFLTSVVQDGLAEPGISCPLLPDMEKYIPNAHLVSMNYVRVCCKDVK